MRTDRLGGEIPSAYFDLRLVVLPHVQTAHFGGDPDNITYPRHSLDFAFLRAYEGGKPADTTKHYFKWKSGGAKKDELVFVSGNPGTTNRLFTKTQLELERDIRIPMEIERPLSISPTNPGRLRSRLSSLEGVAIRHLEFADLDGSLPSAGRRIGDVPSFSRWHRHRRSRLVAKAWSCGPAKWVPLYRPEECDSSFRRRSAALPSAPPATVCDHRSDVVRQWRLPCRRTFG